jgi:hypothetical protein
MLNHFFQLKKQITVKMIIVHESGDCCKREINGLKADIKKVKEQYLERGILIGEYFILKSIVCLETETALYNDGLEKWVHEIKNLIDIDSTILLNMMVPDRKKEEKRLLNFERIFTHALYADNYIGNHCLMYSNNSNAREKWQNIFSSEWRKVKNPVEIYSRSDIDGEGYRTDFYDKAYEM